MNMGMIRKVSPPSQWTQDGWEQEDFYRRVYDFEKHHFSARTNYNVFWSANNYEMPNPIPRLDTEIEYWYGTSETKARRADIDCVRKTFSQTRFRELKGYAHAQLVVVHPEGFCKTAMQFLGEG